MDRDELDIYLELAKEAETSGGEFKGCELDNEYFELSLVRYTELTAKNFKIP